MVKDKKIIAVAGPTASGKSSLAMKLSERFGAEIVCCDSMQIYKGMDIGTAKPTCEDRRKIPHHMVDFLDPSVKYSCADYASDADKCIAEIHSRGTLPLLCGGTGLYLDSLLFERPFSESIGESDVRERLTAEAEKDGAEAMWKRLEAVDPQSAAATHQNNVRRVIRALEIYELTGKKKSELDALPSLKKYDACVLILHTPDRALQNRRIEERTEIMLREGLIEETQRLLESGALAQNNTATQAIGYKEILGYVRGECTLDEAKEKLIIATRQYAKRQDTWFSGAQYRDYAHRIEITEENPDPFPCAESLVNEFLEK